MIVTFTKMNGLGNDFVVLDTISQRLFLNEAQIRRLADRRLGIGCDQVLLLEAPRSPDAHFYYRIFNQNGQEVEQCGNGARCVARFAKDMGLVDSDIITIETMNSRLQAKLEPNGMVKVNMGTPILDPEKIPFISPYKALVYTLQNHNTYVQFSALGFGNPHAVILVDDLNTVDVDSIGQFFNEHEQFPNGVNVSFIQVLNRTHIAIRVYERGVGETPACGTAACAAMASLKLRGLLNSAVTVTLPGGQLWLEWTNDKTGLWMTGPAVSVFHGKFRI